MPIVLAKSPDKSDEAHVTGLESMQDGRTNKVYAEIVIQEADKRRETLAIILNLARE
jgi:hypothetical protein